MTGAPGHALVPGGVGVGGRVCEHAMIQCEKKCPAMSRRLISSNGVTSEQAASHATKMIRINRARTLHVRLPELA